MALVKAIERLSRDLPGPRLWVLCAATCRNLHGEGLWPSWMNLLGDGFFIHLSDVHLDATYTVGANSQCGFPVCCQAANGAGTEPNNTAGPWGEYACDTSPTLALDVLEYIAGMDPQPDFVRQ